MREIKFRGYSTRIGWVYGSLVNNLWNYSELSQHKKGSPCYEIITGKYDGDCWQDIAEQEGEAIVSVVPDSVGQYTGIKADGQHEVYEGDVCKWNTRDGSVIGTIIWEQQASAFWFKWNDGVAYRYKELKVNFSDGKLFLNDNIEIIGNVYEHQKLVTGRYEA